MSRIRDLGQRVRAAMLRPLDPALERQRTHPLYWLRLSLQIGRKWAEDRSPQQAGLLTFQTSLSLVPAIAMGFAVLQATKMIGAQSALIDYISAHVLPVSGGELTERLIAFSANISSGALGLLGVTSTAALAYLLFQSMEGIFNDIWRVRERRSLLGKLTVFYPLVTLSPLLLGITLYYTTRFWFAPALLGFLAPMFSTFLGFTLLNKLLPRTRVAWRAAMGGALVSALLFELAKGAFQIYVHKIAFESFRGIYGSIGLVPILLLWIYYTWLVVLFGAEVAYSVQNLPAMEAAERTRLRAAWEREEAQRRVNGRVAARLMLAVAENFARGDKALPAAELVRRYRVSEDVVDRIFARLKEHDLAVEVFGDVAGFMPARPLAEIRLRDVLALFAAADLHDVEQDALSRLQQHITATQDELVAQLTYADLISAPPHSAAQRLRDEPAPASAPAPGPATEER